MALLKKIELNNGIIVNYHRIVSVNKITNNSTIIEIASYINEVKRQEEIEKKANKEQMDIFIETTFLNKEYNEQENIQDLYEYLKTTEKFKDAENA